MSEPTVLVSTCADDPTADLVIAELNRRSVPVLRLDPGMDFPLHSAVTARLGGESEQGEGWRGGLSHRGRSLRLDRVRSLYHRRPSLFRAPHLGDGQDAAFAAGENRRGLGGVLHTLPGCLYLNHPMRVAAAEYKPLQLDTAVRCGLLVPATLITNSPTAARRFAADHGPVVYKPLHAAAYDLAGEQGCIWVRPVAPDELDDSITGAAHLFQQQVPKVADARVIVVGDETFCARITSPGQVVDWRADYSRLRYQRAELPDGTAVPLRRFMAELGLLYGAVDFAIADDGSWWFLECNPNGQWAWLEPAADLPITLAIADLLEKGAA